MHQTSIGRSWSGPMPMRDKGDNQADTVRPGLSDGTWSSVRYAAREH